MTEFSLAARWLDGDLDYPEETATLAEITVAAAGVHVSSMFDPQAGAAVEGPRLPASVLASGLADLWWTILYEPQKVEADRAFEARHRLDALTRGYVFPPLALWSAGETMTGMLLKADRRFHSLVFATPEKRGPWILPRVSVESALGDFIKATVEQLGSRNVDASALRTAWQRIEDSASDPAEREWCINAGRLGLDPYAADTPDLNRIADGLPDSLFGDICEAAAADDVVRTCQWANNATFRLRGVPAISTKQFGGPPRRELDRPGWSDGYDAARLLRSRMSLPSDPRKAVDAFLGDAAISPQGQIEDAPQDAVVGIAERRAGEMRAVVSARSPGQRRFRMCRATYMAWRAGPNGDAAATAASTWRQQASRAFAAELLAPASLLKERTGRAGLTQATLQRLAHEWGCPTQAIVHQAENHKIPLHAGVDRALHNF